MTEMEIHQYTPKEKPFNAIERIHRFLYYPGYTHLLSPRNQCTNICHRIFRYIVLLGIAIYMILHYVYLVQLGDNRKKAVECLIETFPEMFLFFKAAALLFGTKRLKKLMDTINDDMFGAHSEQDEQLIKEHTKLIIRIWRTMMILLSCICCTWMLSPIFKRMQNPNEEVPSYFPFKQDTWPKFLTANFLNTTGVVLWVGHGHMSADCLIGAYLAQARLQLQIINYNLEHLCDQLRYQAGASNGRYEYIDVVDKTIQKRFVFYIRRYDIVIWYTNEVTSIFNFPLTFQFFIATCGNCLVAYQMSSIDNILSVEFFFALLYYVVNQSQVFIHCYFGGMIEHESKLLNDSLYKSEWTSLSPRFRKQLSIAMCRWMRPVIPTIAGIVPLSHATFLSTTRLAYTMYTVLKSRN